MEPSFAFEGAHGTVLCRLFLRAHSTLLALSLTLTVLTLTLAILALPLAFLSLPLTISLAATIACGRHVDCAAPVVGLVEFACLLEPFLIRVLHESDAFGLALVIEKQAAGDNLATFREVLLKAVLRHAPRQASHTHNQLVVAPALPLSVLAFPFPVLPFPLAIRLLGGKIDFE